jgi:long-subunit acyl-CoA synthetase (AMP-forming)
LFEGPNACAGFWRDGTLHRADPNRTVRTGDLVRREDEHLYFEGRKDQSFKLSNGRLVQAGAVEATLKTAYPELRDALVFSPDGDDIAVALCPNDASAEVPSQDAIEQKLGSLGKRLVWTTTVSPDAWMTQAKGTVDRATMSDTLAKTYRSG